jgi:ankyrin repeat protein
MIAEAYGNGLIVDALLKAGPDRLQTNNKGKTAYAIASEQHTAAVDYLKPPYQ